MEKENRKTDAFLLFQELKENTPLSRERNVDEQIVLFVRQRNAGLVDFGLIDDRENRSLGLEVDA